MENSELQDYPNDFSKACSQKYIENGKIDFIKFLKEKGYSFSYNTNTNDYDVIFHSLKIGNFFDLINEAKILNKG